MDAYNDRCPLNQGVLTLSEVFDDQNEIDKGEEDDIKLFESGEDAAEAFQP
jgi:hypothetical protein